MKKHLHIALIGNPNSGKSSLFNALTGLNQKVGNFPGVTVDKKSGESKLSDNLVANIIDLPGMYSLYPRRSDEWVAYNVVMDPGAADQPELYILIADASNLKRNLLFVSQFIDLKKPVVVALTMMDIAAKKGINVDVAGLERELGVPVIPVNPRRNKGIAELKKAIEQTAKHLYKPPSRNFADTGVLAEKAVSDLKKLFPHISDYAAIHYLINHESFSLNNTEQASIENIEKENNFNHTKVQAEEITQRYSRIKHIMQQAVIEADPKEKQWITDRIDKILLHKFWGYVILLGVLAILFQSIFWLATYPMDAIEWIFGAFSEWLSGVLPQNWFGDLIVNGFVAGLGGIVVFIPQIMILFGLITILEDTGYMARISFLTDKLMRKVGLNGKSVMPMISSFACAVPAIMSARNIENKKERLLTIMISPLMSCSARLPVYIILISLVIPNTYYFGFISLQGLVMTGLYLLGFVVALFVSYIMKWFINIKEKSFFILELPVYRTPRWKTVITTMIEKAKIFTFQAGKVILVISLILWLLSSYGPSKTMQALETSYEQKISQNPDKAEELDQDLKSEKLENSYVGILGKAIEPAIKPLGYDWKIGIALITSFAAREVFVGTMATIYSVGDDADENSATLREKMHAATWPDGSKIYTLASGVSLMIFYVFAMQCMSTLAIVKRETRSWKWPLIQLAYMTVLAYALSFVAYNLLR
ncbi:MAG: ferrous iron transport protein B [Terrimonas sp.]|nr:ferrous iron transport protein B [Terrimonas sp.]OJY81542.1 MAG: ferrous iron transport protein B [Sphingobacteriales bacterium 40-81]